MMLFRRRFRPVSILDPSNHSWPDPNGHNARRFTIVDRGPAHAQATNMTHRKPLGSGATGLDRMAIRTSDSTCYKMVRVRAKPHTQMAFPSPAAQSGTSSFVPDPVSRFVLRVPFTTSNTRTGFMCLPLLDGSLNSEENTNSRVIRSQTPFTEPAPTETASDHRRPQENRLPEENQRPKSTPRIL